jgi:hypothetical protein
MEGREGAADGWWCRTGAMGGGGRIQSSSGCRPPPTRGAPSPSPRLRRRPWLRLDLDPLAQQGGATCVLAFARREDSS